MKKNAAPVLLEEHVFAGRPKDVSKVNSMKNWILVVFLSIFWIALIVPKSYPCSSFCLDVEDRVLVGKNYDWVLGDGLIIVNKRGVKKTAFNHWDETIDKPIRWKSKFGSITLNQFGRELPMGGINEKGLVVEILMLTETVYPKPDPRPSISGLQWIQYQLDNFESTKEVIAGNARLRIHPPPSGLGMHYFVCDRSGDCASIEFLQGKSVFHTGDTMPVKVLTNNTYEASFQSWEQQKRSPSQYGTSGRFVRAAELLKRYDPKKAGNPVDYTFSILENVSQGSFTKWSIVYDLKTLNIHFRTLSNPKIRRIAVGDFEFSCTPPVWVLDINSEVQGDVSGKFIEYHKEINRALIRNALMSISTNDLNRDEMSKKIADYPDENLCTR